MDLQRVAFHVQQARPVVALGNDGLPFERSLRLLRYHLEEEQVRQLLNVVAIREAVVPEGVAIVPEFLDDALDPLGHQL